jgi:hypothetical protein
VPFTFNLNSSTYDLYAGTYAKLIQQLIMKSFISSSPHYLGTRYIGNLRYVIPG